MNFADPAVAAVFADYEVRRIADEARMASMNLADGMNIRDELLLPVGPEVGAFLHSLIIARRPRCILELGTSFGYSTLFMADAARTVSARLITVDISSVKQAHASNQLARADIADVVDFRCGDAALMIAQDDGPFDFVLLDVWNELYLPCFEAFYPKLSDEGIIAADNMIYPEHGREPMRQYRAAVRAKADLQTALLPIGSGIDLSVKWVAGNAKL